ncbi:MAG: Crp/Fnr family transcriptional regulator [Bacteroidales bacterium]|nr:Crp/Fnr family transcriptional regulator [Bacteroidales bacterium]
MDNLLVFKSYIEQIISSNLSSWDELLPLLEYRETEKGGFLTRESQEFRYELFLIRGVARNLLSDSRDREVNISFLNGPQVMEPYFIRNVNGKQIYSVQALEYCEYFLFSAAGFSALINKYLDIRNFAYAIVESELRLRIQKEKIFVTQPARERLNFFRKLYPGLENRVPLHHVASYLGISQVSLSRLRSS